jgi:hypothetical protein
MARDYEDIDDIDDLDDDELRALVRQALAESDSLDIDLVAVRVESGHVTLAGRVGTDEERRVADHIVSDVLGIEEYENDIVVDATRRATAPEAADEQLDSDDRREASLLGERPVPLSPEHESRTEEIDEELYGTTDVQHAIEEGTPWIPPEGPTPEGRDGDSASWGQPGEAR